MERFQPTDDHTGTLPVAGSDAIPVTQPDARRPDQKRPEWVAERRAALTQPGKYLAYEESGNQLIVPLTGEWTRIGRSLSAEIRFDDATVSRRHALVQNGDDGTRVLDDRSLNGVFVNGERTKSSPLRDGDEITVGRHLLFYLDTATVGSASAPRARRPPERSG
jgi:pSer/pThr/pTyr-binding forkhead associated (FHA) protein